FVCAEELAYLRPGQLDDELERSGPWGRAAWASLFAAFPGQCDVWRVPPAPREVFTPVRTAVPTLAVTGQLDQITPPAYGRTVQRQARASQYVEVPGAGHSPVLNAGPCGIALV